MDHATKVRAWIDEARGRGTRGAAPPLYRLLWSLGVHIAPPHFMGFWSFTLVFAVVGSITLALALWAVDALGFGQGESSLARILKIAFLSVFCALWMAWFRRRQNRSLGLPPWREYRPTPSGSGADGLSPPFGSP